jgi:hypothetical protein
LRKWPADERHDEHLADSRRNYSHRLRRSITGFPRSWTTPKLLLKRTRWAGRKKAEQLLKIEIDDEAFATVYGHVSRPYPSSRSPCT